MMPVWMSGLTDSGPALRLGALEAAQLDAFVEGFIFRRPLRLLRGVALMVGGEPTGQLGLQL